MPGYGMRYSQLEDAKILEFVYQEMKNDNPDATIGACGDILWQLAFDRNLLPGHSAKSMRERFRLKLLKDLKLGGWKIMNLISKDKIEFIKKELQTKSTVWETRKRKSKKSRGLDGICGGNERASGSHQSTSTSKNGENVEDEEIIEKLLNDKQTKFFNIQIKIEHAILHLKNGYVEKAKI